RWPRWVAGAGLAGCLLLAGSLPAASVLAGAAARGAGVAVWAVLAASRRGSGGSTTLPPG
ncbi:MAG TPA: hypothetical protein VHS79_01315, partial [Actinomycetes bacterium]|nr:hypothetical protein [Actinomycetes bacterium]